jgi:hypothetical protein
MAILCFMFFFERTHAEEEIAKQFPTEREWVYNFANVYDDRKWNILAQKSASSWKHFFSVGNQFFLFYNFNTATHAYDRLKNRNFE